MTTATIQKWGNSQGIRLPRKLLRDIGLSVGNTFTISRKNNQVVLTPRQDVATTSFEQIKSVDLDQLFINGPAEPPEIVDWGKPVGKEIW